MPQHHEVAILNQKKGLRFLVLILSLINRTLANRYRFGGFTLAFLLCACGDSSTTEPLIEVQRPAINVATSTNIIKDWAQQVGGDRVTVFSVQPLGSDPHHIQPSAQDIALVSRADLLLTVGLGLEAEWIDKLLRNVVDGSLAPAKLGETIDPSSLLQGVGHEHHDNKDHEDEHHDDKDHDDKDHEDEHHDDKDHEDEDHEDKHQEVYDPHFWLDPLKTKIVVSEIARLLSSLDPDGSETYQDNAANYMLQLDELHQWTEERVSMVSADQKLLVTSHGSLQYFAHRYGFEIVDTIFTGLASESEPSALELTKLTNEIRNSNISTIFAEGTTSPKLATAIANETGAKLITGLYTDSLGLAGQGADTYIGMMKTNINIIVGALE